MDDRELRVRQAELLIQELHHQTSLRHSDLQRRFLFALTLAGGVFLSLLRAEVPLWAVIAAAPPLAWAASDARAIRRIAGETHEEARQLILTLGKGPRPAKDSRPAERNDA